MKIAVCVKQVPDTETRVKLTDDHNSIVEDGIKWILNPYDEFAVEEALKLKEAHQGEVTIISMGDAGIEKTIRDALAMGADKAVRLNSSRVPRDPSVVAKALADYLKDQDFDIIFFGKQAIDDDHSQTSQMVAHLLDLPCASVVVKLDVDFAAGKATASREVEGGDEKLSFPLPAVIAAQRGLNQPRYRSLKGIMKAKKTPIEVVETNLAEDKLAIEKFEYPPQKKPGRIIGEGVDAVPELVRLLKDEAKVL